MGLGITAYRKLTPAQGNEAFGETGELMYDEGWVQLYANPDFPTQADDIKDDHAYRYEETIRFHAGSYGGYGRWRDELAELAGYELGEYGAHGRTWSSYAAAVWANPQKPGPFVELINFSDCEGTIGAKTSAKLAKDFSDFQEKADTHTEEYFRQKYAEWRKAFEMAADGGAVRFH